MRTPHLPIAAISVALLASAAQGQTLRDAQRLNTTGFNPNPDNAINGAVVDTGGGIFVTAWTEQFGTNEFQQDIYSSRSTDDGATWSTPVRVDLGDMPNEFDSDNPKIAVSGDGQSVVVIWEDNRSALPLMATAEDVLCNYSTDGGQTWQPSAFALNIATSGPDVDSDVDRLWIDADGDTFHVTWEEDDTSGLGGAEDVYYTRSTDGGMTWSNPIILNPVPGVGDVDDPKVAADSGNVVVTWAAPDTGNDDLWVAVSNDGGATFAPAAVVDSDPAGNVDEPIVEVRGMTAIVACNENDPTTPAGEGITCAVSTDGGVTWTPDETLSVQMQSVTSADSDTPDVTILGEGEVFVAFDEDSQDRVGGGSGGSGGNRVYVSYTTDGGANWTKDVELAGGLIANRPVLTAGDDAVTMYFEFSGNGSNTGAFQVSFDKGATWGAPIDVISSGPDVDEGANHNEGTYVRASRETEDVVVIFMDRPTGNNEVYVAGLDFDLGIGIRYCTANPNSTGAPAEIEAFGSLAVANDDLTLRATGVPVNQFGIFVTSQTSGFSANVGEGNLCLAGNIGRFFLPSQILSAGTTGTYALNISLDEIPQGTVLVSIQPGETWYFQSWYRDLTSNGLPTSNFTDGVELAFQ